VGQSKSNYSYPATSNPRWNPLVGWPANELLCVFDETGTVVPNVATGWKWSADHLTLDITLPQTKIKFHDGTDFNAQAVKFNHDLLMTVPGKPSMGNVTSVEVIDDYTVRWHLSQYDNIAVVDLATEAGVVQSPTAIKTYGQDYFYANSVGIGPFKCVSSVRDVSVKYEKFADYWRPGKPYLDGIQFTFIADPVTAKLAFLGGEGQLFGDVSAVDAADLMKKGNYQVSVAPNQMVSLAPDSINPKSPFADIRVRRALGYAVDAKAIVDAVSYGFFPTANQASFPGVWSYNKNVVGFNYDPAKAKALLAEAGYPNGFKTKLTYMTGLSDVATAVVAAQRYLAEVGTPGRDCF
jgi:peptide/nickel transport system substrate-binding protein